MGRTARDDRDLPHPKPVQKIQLSDAHARRRLIAIVLLLVIGGAALGYGIAGLFTPQSGWQVIEADTSAGPTCGEDFTFLYDLGSDGAVLRAESRGVTDLYSEGCRKALQLFHTIESFEGIVNLRDLSLHPNETLTVDGALYRALETVQSFGDRTIYLGPVYARYGDIFLCRDDSQLVDFDPRLSEDVRQEYETLAAYARDPGAVDLRLLGDGQVRLEVSAEYLAFAQREGVDTFLDFGWLTNAFIVDYLADLLVENGYTHGSISSYDGFNRNLDSRGQGYAQNIYDRVDGMIYPAAVMEYTGPMSIVGLHSYPIDDRDGQRFYQLKNGEIRTNYLDPADGLCKSAVQDLTCYSKTERCAELALELAPIYVAEALDTQALDRLGGRGIHSIYCRDRVIYGTDPDLTLTQLFQSDSVHYTAKH